MPRRLITCASCHQERLHEGRGLCSPCYQWHRRRGLLEQFQRSLHRSLDEWLTEIDQSDPDACWPWPGSKNEDGYGIAWVAPRMHPAHRAVYEHMVGKIPEGHTLDHMCHDSDTCRQGVLCPHRSCVNYLRHLKPATHVDNARRSLADRATCNRGHEQTEDNLIRRDGRTWCRRCYLRATKQRNRINRSAAGERVHLLDGHCINGHELTPENTYRHPRTGYRECQTCRRAHYRSYYARKKVAASARERSGSETGKP